MEAKLVVHFLSLSVDYSPPPLSPSLTSSPSSVRATVQLIEQDTGGPNDFFSISLDLVVKARGSSHPQLSVSLDDLLTLRHVSASSTTGYVRLHARGAVPLGQLSFPNGPDACQAFILALRAHASFRHLSDPNVPGTLYLVDAKPRMRRAAPTLMPLYFPQPSDSSSTSNNNRSSSANDHDQDEDDEFNALLSDLNISPSSTTRQRNQERLRQRQRLYSNPFRQTNENTNPGQNLGLTLLTQFARVTQVARDIGGHIAKMADEERKRREETQQQQRSSRASINAALDIHANIAASTDDENELPPRMPLESPRGVPVKVSTWKALLDGNGQINDTRVLRYAIFAGGIEPKLRASLWPFLLGVFSWNSSEEEREAVVVGAREEYEALKKKANRTREDAQLEDRQSLEEECREGENFNGERNEDAPSDADAFGEKKSPSQNGNTERRERLSPKSAQVLQVWEQIAKDVVRTDRTNELFLADDSPALVTMETVLNVYAVYNPEISYCQGMSDFLAPLLIELGDADGEKWKIDEALAFWCFERLMRRMEANFRLDQSGMHAQLTLLRRIITLADRDLAKFFSTTDPKFYSCFRWIVVRYKREFKTDDITRLWEILWSKEVAGNNLHIYMAAGLLLAHRKQLLKIREGAFDMLLRYINDMSMRIDVDFAVHEGVAWFEKLGDAVNVDAALNP